MVQFWYFFFTCREGELFSFGNDFTGPRDLFEFWPAVSHSRTKVFFAPFHVILMPNFDILSCGYSYFTPGKGYLSLILCPLSRGSEGFFFVTKNNSPGVSPRVNHGKGNDKCINSTYRFTMSKLISCTSHTWRLNNHIIYNSYKP